MVFKISLGDIRLWEIVIILYLLFFLIFSSIKRTPLFIGRKSIYLFILPFYFATFISVVNIEKLIFFIPGFLIFTFMIILFLIISNQKISDLTKVVNVFIYIGIISSIWAFIEIFFNIGSTGSKWYGVISRADSFFSEPNEFSQYLVMPFAYIISKIFTSTYYNSKTTNINYIIFFLIILAAQILSFSRGGILAFMTQLLFAFFFK